MTRTPGTLYSTWLQLAKGDKPAKYLVVICVAFKDGEPCRLTMLNLDGTLDTKEITPEQFQKFVDARAIIQCPLIPPNQDKKI